MRLNHEPVKQPPVRHRYDPDYDAPRPLEMRELLDPWLWIGAIAVVAGLLFICAYMFAVVPGPK